MNYCNVAITAFVAAVSVPAFAQEQPVLRPKGVKDTWVGKVLIGTTADGTITTLKLQPDGTASGNDRLNE